MIIDNLLFVVIKDDSIITIIKKLHSTLVEGFFYLE